jgi:hypothetical protein
MPGLRGLKIIDSESPDFLCEVTGVPTGIEVTRFFFPVSGGFPPQTAEAYRRRLGDALTGEHLQSTITPVQVSVRMYRDDALFKPVTRAALKKELFSFVSHRIPPPGPYVEFGSESLAGSLCDKGVDSITIINANLTRPCWSFSYASFIPESSSSIVQGIINEKDRLVSKYRQKADKLWLLILSGAEGLHSTVGFDRDVLTHKYATDFDRLFLFRTFGASAHELKRV